MKIDVKSFMNKHKKLIDHIGIGIIIALYFVVKVLLIKESGKSNEYEIFDFFKLDSFSLSGIFTQMQLMLIVYLSILYRKKGYIIAMVLCVTSVGEHFIPLLFGGQIISVIGMVMMIGGGLIATIIYVYGNYMDKQKAQLNEMANYDYLTGLINRRTIFNELNNLCEGNHKEPFTIVFIDIDDFKMVNDVAGHYQGDLLLKKIVQVWKDLVANEDLLGRIGGDEFALIIKRQLTDEEIRTYIQTLKSALIENIHLGSGSQLVTASFGVSKYPKDSNTARKLLQYADTAMYVAKSAGKNDVQFFSKKMYEEMMYSMQLENALTHAIDNNEMYLMYQPQYECHNKKLRGFEVLLRWHSKKFGVISPAEFIPLAEKTGYIINIGEWVLEVACIQFKKLLDQYDTKKILSVNISALQLLEPNFIEVVKRIIEKTAFDPNYLEFEITESVFISSKDYIIGILNELKMMGIHIALDDFGTNYASLSYIQMLPLDILKIDKSFIDSIVDKNNTTNLVGAIISIAQELNYKVIAEGIEKQEQLQYLDEKGCDYVQGYLWGRPLIEKDVDHLLNTLAR